jgi:hypothetical protein
MEIELEFRLPTPSEKALIYRLLETDFPGKSEVASQLSDFRVRRIDCEGSLELKVQSVFDPAPVLKRIPVEAEGVDQDGVGVHLLLHVVGGVVKELEVYKDDGSAISRIPSPRELKVFVLPP